mmetsp:Transcript_32958/g.57863  ORF Transcript_32958/g.57863 Transcript_32958/m.57863 type:complete len:168 (+) Transcript_32958:1840-2343(+)
MKRQEEERRQRIKSENDEKRRKLNEVRRSLLNDRRSQARTTKLESSQIKQESSYYMNADFLERKHKQKAVAGDFMQLLHHRDQRSSSLKERLKASFQNKMQMERQATEDMNQRIKRLEELEQSMMDKLRASKERVQTEKGRYDKLMLNRSVYDSREVPTTPKADSSL